MVADRWLFPAVCLACLPSASAAESDAADVSQRVLEARREFESGEVRFRVRAWKPAEPGQTIYDLRYVSTFSEDGLRTIKHTPRVQPAGEGGAGLRVTTGSSVAGVVQHADVGVPDLKPLVASQTPAGGDAAERRRGELFEPRLLGIVGGLVSQLAGEMELDADLGSPKIVPGSARAETTATGLIRLEQRMSWGTDALFEIDPGRGYNPTKIVSTRPDFVDQTTITLKEWRPGVWFPATIITDRFDLTADRKRHVMRERVLVESADFGTPVDQEVFGLAGLNLKPGTRVVGATAAQPIGGVWDGEELVPVRGGARETAEPPRASNGWWISALCGVAAFATLFLYLRTR